MIEAAENLPHALIASGAYGSIIELIFSMIRDASDTISGRQTVHLARLLIVDRPGRREAVVGYASAAPILFGLSFHRLCLWVFHLHPTVRATRAIKRPEPLGHNALAAEPAGVLKHDLARRSFGSVILAASSRHWRANSRYSSTVFIVRPTPVNRKRDQGQF